MTTEKRTSRSRKPKTPEAEAAAEVKRLDAKGCVHALRAVGIEPLTHRLVPPNDGGLALGHVVSDQSVYAINSGPASAPQAALWLGEPWGTKDIITVDMGGTSFDITLTRDGRANVSKNIDFLRYRIGIPMIQVETLGAGGGSIGWIDKGGFLHVGPRSAGAEPGPVGVGARGAGDRSQRRGADVGG